jgi:hypothetical protein
LDETLCQLKNGFLGISDIHQGFDASCPTILARIYAAIIRGCGDAITPIPLLQQM